MSCGPGECWRSTSRAAGACVAAAPDDALRTIRPATAGFTVRRLLLSSPLSTLSLAWENANGNFAAALYPYNVMVLDSVVGVHWLASSGDIFGCIVMSTAFGDGVLSSGDAFLGIASFSLEDVESSGCIFCLETVGAGLAVAVSVGVDR